MTYLQYAVLGLIQGLAEFLPVSSSAHLIIARCLMGITEDTPALLMLDVLLHAGTLLAVAIVFWNDWADMLRRLFRSKLLGLLFLASLPALAAYVLAGDFLETFHSGWFIGPSFLFTAVLLLISDAISRRRAGKTVVKAGSALAMGCFQVLGLLPGVSRSGATIAGGLFAGLDRRTAAKFSFMMSAPAILASLLAEGKDAIENGYLANLEIGPAAVAVIIAAVSGWFALRVMMNLIARTPLNWFALYVAVAALAFMTLQLAGWSGVPAFGAAQAAAAELPFVPVMHE